jgi:hypothetical protein
VRKFVRLSCVLWASDAYEVRAIHRLDFGLAPLPSGGAIFLVHGNPVGCRRLCRRALAATRPEALPLVPVVMSEGRPARNDAQGGPLP